MLKSRLSASVVLAVLALAACGETPSPVVPPAPTPTVAVPEPAPTPSVTATATAEPVAPVADIVPLHPVASVYSLLDVIETDGSLLVRTGYDPGGGIVGRYRYAPILDGVIDFEQETSELAIANTATDASVELAGKWPDVLRRATAGFRSAAEDRYQTLGADGVWKTHSVASRPGVGWEIFELSDGRLLEFRKHVTEPVGPDQPESWLPELRVIRGSTKDAPSLPGSLEKRLKKEGFMTSAIKAFRTGEVVAVGSVLEDDNKLATVVWRDKPKEPEYFLTTIDVPPKTALDATILGGDSLASVRVLCGGDRVMRLEGKSWVQESKVPESGFPDVWFGKPIVRAGAKGTHARMAAGAPWKLVAVVQDDKTIPLSGDLMKEYIAVDAAGVLWTEMGELLVSSKPPAGGMRTITEADLVKRRKASVLFGGSNDVTNQPPDFGVRGTCTTHYVLFDQMPVSASAGETDYPAVRKILKGHPEFSSVKLVVSREKGHQFFGAQVADDDLAQKLENLYLKSVKKAYAGKMCAQPAVVREIKMDFATGDVVK